MRPAHLRETVRSSFWLVPAACVAVAIGLAMLLTTIDQRLGQAGSPLVFTGGPEAARTLLSTITLVIMAIITSMISFTGLVFSITVVVLQLTSSQFSPRVLRTFLSDRANQLALGVFTATFVYAMMVLRTVRSSFEGSPFVPQLATTVAVGLVLLSVGIFLYYIHHITNSIRAASIIAGIGRETRAELDRRYPEDGGDPSPPRPASGAVQDRERERPGNPGKYSRRITDKSLPPLGWTRSKNDCELLRPSNALPQESSHSHRALARWKGTHKLLRNRFNGFC